MCYSLVTISVHIPLVEVLSCNADMILNKVTGVAFRNIHLSNVQKECVSITMAYGGRQYRVDQGPHLPHFQDISLEKVHCEGAAFSYELVGLGGSRIQGLSLKSVSVTGLASSLNGGEAECVNTDCTCDATSSPCPTCCRH